LPRSTVRRARPLMQRGFLYLVAIMDWASRKVLAWRLSNTMDTEFCIEAVEEALAKYGKPEICVGASQRNAALDDWRALISIMLATVMWWMRWWHCPRGPAASPWPRWQKPCSSAQASPPRPTPPAMGLRSGETQGQEAGPPRQGLAPLQGRSVRRSGHVRFPHPARQGHQAAARWCRTSVWPSAQGPSPDRPALRPAPRGSQSNLRNHRTCAGLRNATESDNML
jgi:hypothetical protein